MPRLSSVRRRPGARPGSQATKQLPLDAIQKGATRLAEGLLRRVETNARALPTGRLPRRPAFPFGQSDAEYRSDCLLRPGTPRAASINPPGPRQARAHIDPCLVRPTQVHRTLLSELRRRWAASRADPLSKRRIYARRMDIPGS